MKYIVMKSHVSHYPDPIRLEEGDVVHIGEKYVGTESWDNWVFVMKRGITGKEGFRNKL